MDSKSERFPPFVLETRLLWAARRFPPLQRPKMHHRVGITLWKLEKGEVELSTPQGKHHFTAPCSLLLGSGMSACVFTPESVLASVSVLIVSNETLIFSGPAVHPIDPEKLPSGMEELITLYKQRHAERTMEENVLFQLQIQTQTAQWCLKLAELMASECREPFALPLRHPGLRRAMNWWNEQPQAGTRVTEFTLAQIACMSVSHFKRVFRHEVGMPPSQYAQCIRMKASIEALLHTQKSIKEIGIELGFSNSANFVRWFGKHFELSPKAYRESH